MCAASSSGALRLAVPREIGGRCAADERSAADPPADEVHAADRPDPHGSVEALVDEIDEAVGQLDVESHLRIPRHEFGDRDREMPRAERDAAGQAQRAARDHGPGAGGRLRFLEIREQQHGALVERAADLGQRQRARRAIEQPCVEMRLELGHVARDRRHGDAEAVGRPREASRFDDFNEGLDRMKSIHTRRPSARAVGNYCINSNNVSTKSLFILESNKTDHGCDAPPRCRLQRSPP